MEWRRVGEEGEGGVPLRHNPAVRLGGVEGGGGAGGVGGGVGGWGDGEKHRCSTPQQHIVVLVGAGSGVSQAVAEIIHIRAGCRCLEYHQVPA